MKLKPVLLLWCVLPLACSEAEPDDTPGGGGDGPGSGGSVSTGGSSSSGSAGRGGSAGASGSAGAAAAAGGSTGGGGSAAGGAGAGSGGAAPAGGTTGGGGSSGDAGAGAPGAGSGGMAGDAGADGLFVPDLPNVETDGDGGGLTLVAFTLVVEPDGPAFYAAVSNDGDTPACEAGIMIDFFDASDQLVGNAAAVLLSGRYYEIDDGSGAVLSCVAPGQTAMAGATGLSEYIVIGELARLQHRFPAFTVPDLVELEGLGVSDVEAVAVSGGSAYTGRLTNGLEQSVSNASVTVFPVNAAGRPLGMASSSAESDIPAGESWSFETSAVSDAGADEVAIPTASLTL